MIAGIGLTKVHGYIDAVLSGDQVACEAVRGAVQRHVDDLKRQGQKDFPYHFSTNTAETAIAYFPEMLRHSIGEFAGLSFELEPWQQFAIANIYGWKRDDDNTRRFRKVYLSMARKNGKSSWAAGMALFAAHLDFNPICGRPEPVASVVLAATKKEQAVKVIFAEIIRMVEQSEHLKPVTKYSKTNLELTFPRNSGSIRCVGSDKAYDGLNPHCIVLDEVHAWKEYHRDFYNTMMTGGGARNQPLTVLITTAGADDSHIWVDEYKFARAVAVGEIVEHSTFGLCYELDENDDMFDPSTWIKSNPNLGVSVKLDYLQREAAQCQESVMGRNRFDRYFANRMVSSTESAFDMATWDKCAGKLSDWMEADAIGAGVDLGGRDDLAAWAMVARFPTGEQNEDETPIWRYEAKTFCYVAEESQRDLTKQPFAQFIHEGHLMRSRTPMGDIRKALANACWELRVHDIAYDPWQAQSLAEDLTGEGLRIASMGQTTNHFTEPIQELLQCVTDGRFRHDGNPLLRWCVKNASLQMEASGRCMFSKADSGDKIDPVVAMTMAMKRAMLAPQRPVGSFYIL